MVCLCRLPDIVQGFPLLPLLIPPGLWSCDLPIRVQGMHIPVLTLYHRGRLQSQPCGDALGGLKFILWEVLRTSRGTHGLCVCVLQTCLSLMSLKDSLVGDKILVSWTVFVVPLFLISELLPHCFLELTIAGKKSKATLIVLPTRRPRNLTSSLRPGHLTRMCMFLEDSHQFLRRSGCFSHLELCILLRWKKFFFLCTEIYVSFYGCCYYCHYE